MKYKLLTTILLTWVLFSCSTREGKQFEHAGGTLVFALSNEPTTLIARDVTDLYSAAVLNQCLEGLVSLDPKTLKPIPAIAKSWDVSEDGLEVTFTLRDDIYFHENSESSIGRKLTPEDVKYSVELACKKAEGKEPSTAYNFLYKSLLKGSEAFHNGETDEISGLKIGKNTVTFKLNKFDANFIDKLASVNAFIVLKEMVEANKEAKLIGTGPFTFEKYMDVDDQLCVVFKKNNNYYQTDAEGNKLPYLDSLVFIIEPKSLRQLEMFEEGRTQMIDGLPPSRITSMLEGRIEDFNSSPPKLMLKRKPLLATQYYHFNLTNELFKDVRVRKAINYAVDKEDILRNVLNNQAHGIGDAGVVPPMAFNGYKSEEIKKHGYTFNPEKAKKLLAEAGYPNGEGFPHINLKFNIGTIHSGVADRFAKHMKKYLNIIVNIDGLTFEDKLRDQMYAKGDIFRTSWYADYYSPETFLMNFHGASVPASINEPSLLNHARYQNPNFDKLFEKGKESRDLMERYKHFAEAEKIMMDDAPLIVLWYEETIKIAQSRVRNLNLNEMNYYSFRDVYLKDWTKEEYEAFLAKNN